MFEDIKEHMDSVERELSRGLDSSTPYLDEMANHIVGAGGKRVRPAMAIYAAWMFGDISEKVYRAAAALEYLHTATLLHDDVVDEADKRRDQDTARILWSNASSVLVGDYLLAFAFKSLTKLGDKEVLDLISETTMLMSRGELLQLASSCITSSERDYLDIIHCKTACLFGAAVQIGGILGGAEKELHGSLYEYGHGVGMAFQMVDDALDYSRVRIGKPLGTDFREGKITMPLSRLLLVASPEERSELQQALSGSEVDDVVISRVVDLMQKYKIDDYTRRIALERVEKSLSLLDKMPKGEARDSLMRLAWFVVERQY